MMTSSKKSYDLDYYVGVFKKILSQPAFTCSKLAIETPCSSVSIVNFEGVIAGWDVVPNSC